MSCNPRCYQLSPSGYESGIYKLVTDEFGESVWYSPPNTDGYREKVTVPAIITLLSNEVNNSSPTQIDCSSISQSPPSLSLLPYGITYEDESGAITPPANARSITVMVEPNSSSRLEVSFDGGLTYPLYLRKKETKSWNQESGILDLSTMRIRPKGNSGVATFDIHGEKE